MKTFRTSPRLAMLTFALILAAFVAVVAAQTGLAIADNFNTIMKTIKR